MRFLRLQILFQPEIPSIVPVPPSKPLFQLSVRIHRFARLASFRRLLVLQPSHSADGTLHSPAIHIYLYLLGDRQSMYSKLVDTGDIRVSVVILYLQSNHCQRLSTVVITREVLETICSVKDIGAE